MRRVLIENGRLVTPDSILAREKLLIEDGRIAAIGKNIENHPFAEVIDAENRYVAPGFIDLHLQGTGGADIIDAAPEAIRTMASACGRFGVTGFLGTTHYVEGEKNEHLKNAAGMSGKETGGAELHGIYLEGPFISPGKLGMISPHAAVPAAAEVMARILDLTGGHLRLMTVAPELEGAARLIDILRNNGVVPSFGHSIATFEQTVAGIAMGIRHATHLFNAMPPIHHRDPGPIPAIFESGRVVAELICDGAHLHPSIIRLAVNRLGNDRFVLITDGMRAMGMPDGSYEYSGIPFTAEKGIARYIDGTYMGTATGMNTMVKNCMKFTGLPLPQVVRAASLNPARVLGLEKRKGSLETGKDADIVILDDDLSAWKTFVRGREIFGKDGN